MLFGSSEIDKACNQGDRCYDDRDNPGALSHKYTF